jgi:c-di-GMP-binding flagellar brake protein YcgR
MMKNQNSSANEPAGKNQSVANELSLDEVNLRISDSVELQVGNKCHAATLIGYLKTEGLIVTMPTGKNGPAQMDKGQPLTVRVFSSKHTYAFEAAIRHITNTPFPHLYLTYPEVVRKLKDRQYERVRVNITGSADASNGESFTCVVRDISMGGALIAVNDQTGLVNDRLLLTLRIVIDGVEYSLKLDSEIRSIRVEGSPDDDENAPVLHSLAFHNLSKQDFLALAAFDLLPDWGAQLPE